MLKVRNSVTKTLLLLDNLFLANQSVNSLISTTYLIPLKLSGAEHLPLEEEEGGGRGAGLFHAQGIFFSGHMHICMHDIVFLCLTFFSDYLNVSEFFPAVVHV